MALRFEPSRFFLKGKVTQKQTSYKHKHTVRIVDIIMLSPQAYLLPCKWYKTCKHLCL